MNRVLVQAVHDNAEIEHRKKNKLARLNAWSVARRKELSWVLEVGKTVDVRCKCRYAFE